MSTFSLTKKHCHLLGPNLLKTQVAEPPTAGSNMNHQFKV